MMSETPRLYGGKTLKEMYEALRGDNADKPWIMMPVTVHRDLLDAAEQLEALSAPKTNDMSDHAFMQQEADRQLRESAPSTGGERVCEWAQTHWYESDGRYDGYKTGCPLARNMNEPENYCPECGGKVVVK